MESDAKGQGSRTRVEGPPLRTWGIWTKAKLEILRDYLPAFVRASRGKVSEVIYLDAFAGQGHGVDRLTGEEFPGSAQIALDVDVAGGFTKFRYFERESSARELEQVLNRSNPGRDIKVYGGDCNEQLRVALDELSEYRWAPTFAFLDPDGMELAWETISLLANHKKGYRKTHSTRPEYKVEQWMLFPTAGVIRVLSQKEEGAYPS